MIHFALNLIRDEIADKGKAYLVASCYQAESLAMMTRLYNTNPKDPNLNPFETKEKCNHAMEKIGFRVSDNAQKSFELYRKSNDPIWMNLNSQGVDIFNVPALVTIFNIENQHWTAKQIEVMDSYTSGRKEVHVFSLENGPLEYNDRNPTDEFDAAVAILVKNLDNELEMRYHPRFPSVDSHADYFNIPHQTDDWSCGVRAVLMLAQSLLGMERRFDEESLKAVWMHLFAIIGVGLDKFRFFDEAKYVDPMVKDVESRDEDDDASESDEDDDGSESDEDDDGSESDDSDFVPETEGMTSCSVISCQPPWSHLIMSGEKRIENRNWPLPKEYEDKWVALHASKKFAETHDCDEETKRLFGKTKQHILGMYFLQKYLVPCIETLLGHS